MHIPFPALAAILVNTGYKLASPETVMHILEIGKEQLLIFVITLVATLGLGIVQGIVIGIITTIFVHVIFTNSFSVLLKHGFNNNIKFHEVDNVLNIKVLHFSSFINFFRLKTILDQYDKSKKAVIDFLDCKFIDHTVMQNLLEYEQSFDKKNGELKLVGLELHHADTDHPTALRRLINYLTPSIKRQNSLKEYFDRLDWYFDHKQNFHLYFLRNFSYFKTLQPEYIENVSFSKNKKITFFDLKYTEGAFILEEKLFSSMLYIKCNKAIPKFSLSKVDLYERMNILQNSKTISIKNFKDFAMRFSLKGDDVFKIRRIFSNELILFLESNPTYHVESDGKGGILIYDKETLSNLPEVKSLVDYSIRLSELV